MGTNNFGVDSLTYDHIDIHFCYSTSGTGSVNFASDSVLSGGTWIKEDDDSFALRLSLAKAGQFYGWNAEYNNKGQLVFTFLKPVQTVAANNEFGWSLKGTTIVLNPGHGGTDPGALGSNPQYTEAALNLILAQKMQTYLESIRANVVMTRTSDVTTSLDDIVKLTKQTQPDIFVSVHHNASSDKSLNGFTDFYYEPYSLTLAQDIDASASPLFSTDCGSFYYPDYVDVVSDCPAVLTENGFMSNASEYNWLCEDATADSIAKADVQGIVDYFKAISR